MPRPPAAARRCWRRRPCRRRGAVAGRLEAARGVDEGPDPSGPLVGRRPRRSPRPSGRRRRFAAGAGRRRQARPVGVVRRDPRGGQDVVDQARQGLVVGRGIEAGDASRPSSAIRSRTWLTSSATFWWMNEVAKRVSAVVPRRTVTSASASRRPARARGRGRGRAVCASARRSWAGRRRPPAGRSSAHPHPDPAEAGRHRRVARCGRSAAAGPCRSSACPRTSTRPGRRACPSSPRTAG